MQAPSDTELQLLKLFWRHGPLSARELHEKAGPDLGWTVSTTRTVLERMRAKGLVARRNVHGLAVYRAARDKVTVIGAVLGRLGKLLEIDEALPASAFAGSRLLTPDEAAEIERLMSRAAGNDEESQS